MTRSELMSRIRSRGNASTELALARIFRKRGVTGWRRQRKVLGIRPDFVFPKTKTAVFVDGCFWHGCNAHCKLENLEKYWRNKIETNILRDGRQTAELWKAGWQVVRIWEHALKGMA